MMMTKRKRETVKEELRKDKRDRKGEITKMEKIITDETNGGDGEGQGIRTKKD